METVNQNESINNWFLLLLWLLLLLLLLHFLHFHNFLSIYNVWFAFVVAWNFIDKLKWWKESEWNKLYKLCGGIQCMETKRLWPVANKKLSELCIRKNECAVGKPVRWFNLTFFRSVWRLNMSFSLIENVYFSFLTIFHLYMTKNMTNGSFVTFRTSTSNPW